MKELEVKSIPFMDKQFRNYNIEKKIIVLKNMAYYKKLNNEEIDNLLFTKKTILSFSCEEIEQILKIFPKTNISIDVDSFTYVDDVNDCIFENEELKKVYEFNNIIRKNGRTLNFKDTNLTNTFREVLFANRKLKLWAKTINDAKIDGKSLSPLEKFYYAFSLVTKYNYKDAENKSLARNLISILNSDGKFIVCFGYEQLLKELCKKIGIVCCTNMTYVGDIEKETNARVKDYGNHVDCCVLIKDDKYKINGIYYSFPTQCSHEKNFLESLLTIKEVRKWFKNYHIIREHMRELYDDSNLIFDFDYYANKTKRIKKEVSLTAILNVLKVQNYCTSEIKAKMESYINDYNFLDKKIYKINNKKLISFNKKFITKKSLELSF